MTHHTTGNEISRVEGLEGLVGLTELVLDRNKIKVSCVSEAMHTHTDSSLSSPGLAGELSCFTALTQRTAHGREQVCIPQKTTLTPSAHPSPSLTLSPL